jgi:hypothetical protein
VAVLQSDEKCPQSPLIPPKSLKKKPMVFWVSISMRNGILTLHSFFRVKWLGRLSDRVQLMYTVAMWEMQLSYNGMKDIQLIFCTTKDRIFIFYMLIQYLRSVYRTWRWNHFWLVLFKGSFAWYGR